MRTQNIPSIRSIMLSTILFQDISVAETKALVEELHPEKMGAKKFENHYAWYQGWVEKATPEQLAHERKRLRPTYVAPAKVQHDVTVLEELELERWFKLYH